MTVPREIEQMRAELTTWRRDIHAHPETAFAENRTSDLIAERLGGFGLEVHRGLAGTGVVGTLKCGTSDRSIGLRADMDALFLHEENDFAHRSTNDGKMHGCGHDVHTTMLLGAAKYLAGARNFDGTVHFIFQPAEETGNEECGGNRMVRDGLFEQFPVAAVFGMHNFPGIPLGHFAVRAGPMLASIDTFEFKVLSEHNHPATQYTTPDPILIAGRIVEAFHAFKSRGINPAEPAIMSITQFKAGDPVNDKQGVHITPRPSSCAGHGLHAGRCGARCVRGAAEGNRRGHREHRRGALPVRVSARLSGPDQSRQDTEKEKELAVSSAAEVVGANQVERDMQPLMAAEDFAFMLKQRPGCYILIGNGDGEGTCQVHNPNYDFNDEAIPFGVGYWAKLAERFLAPV